MDTLQQTPALWYWYIEMSPYGKKEISRLNG